MEITLELPRQVTLEGRSLRMTQNTARFLLGELLRHIEAPPLTGDVQVTHMAHSPVLGLVPVSIVACNASACLVRGHLYGAQTSPVRVNKSDLFPLIETLVCEGGDTPATVTTAASVLFTPDALHELESQELERR
ncbi:MAG: hypothetical protein BWY63_00737 [Chloroflexi bacterium ADurb.Bin360]|nr:MAG: hypothetical protein BWY63_00737 [Chloroflexi bacterium ADurb.Bin360]